MNSYGSLYHRIASSQIRCTSQSNKFCVPVKFTTTSQNIANLLQPFNNNQNPWHLKNDSEGLYWGSNVRIQTCENVLLMQCNDGYKITGWGRHWYYMYKSGDILLGVENELRVGCGLPLLPTPGWNVDSAVRRFDNSASRLSNKKKSNKTMINEEKKMDILQSSTEVKIQR